MVQSHNNAQFKSAKSSGAERRMKVRLELQDAADKDMLKLPSLAEASVKMMQKEAKKRNKKKKQHLQAAVNDVDMEEAAFNSDNDSDSDSDSATKKSGYLQSLSSHKEIGKEQGLVIRPDIAKLEKKDKKMHDLYWTAAGAGKLFENSETSSSSSESKTNSNTITPARESYLKGEFDLLSYMLYPVKPSDFFANHWEKKPLVVKREKADFYKDLFSRKQLEKELEKADELLEEEDGRSSDTKHQTLLKYGSEITLARFDPSIQAKVIENVKENGEPASLDEVKNSLEKMGCSIQTMHAQRFSEPVWQLLADLEKKFGCLFGSNSYITPSGYIGFAPHFDDVEVFMLQVEGRKRWRCWTPNHAGVFDKVNDGSSTAGPGFTNMPMVGEEGCDNNDSDSEMSNDSDLCTEKLRTSRSHKQMQGIEVEKSKSKKDCINADTTESIFASQAYSSSLPRTYSRDFTLEECEKQMTLRLDVILEPGDILYIPRGTVHFGEAVKSESDSKSEKFAHHLTVSTYQRTSYADFLQEILAETLKTAAQNDHRFRQGLPVRHLEIAGTLQKCGSNNNKLDSRESFESRIRELFSHLASPKILTNELIHRTADQTGSDFFIQRLPPHRIPDRGDWKTLEECQLKKKPFLVRLSDKSMLRCALDLDPETGESLCLLFYPYRNKQSMHMRGEAALQEALMKSQNEGEDPNASVRLQEMFFPALKALFRLKEGEYIDVRDLPLEELGDKEALCNLLWELHLLEVKK